MMARSNQAQRRNKKPQPHPLVRQARRAAELAAIEVWCREHGVTWCPPAYAAATPQGAPGVVVVPSGDDAPVVTVADCERWLLRQGYGVRALPGGSYLLGNRRYPSAALVAHVAQLQARVARGRDAARAAILGVLADRAVAGRRCPSSRALHRRLLARGLLVPRDGVLHLLEGLVAEGHIAVRTTMGNARIVTLLTGPHAGASTAHPAGHA